MILDRKLQLNLLEKIAECYPFEWDDYERSVGSEDYLKIAINLHYLKGHGLLEAKTTKLVGDLSDDEDRSILIMSPIITEKGLDFLADDGGLSAILGIVTIKFEAEQLKILLESKIMAADLPPADKHKLIDGLRSLSSESIKHLTTKIVDLGWDNLPTLIRIIQSNLS